jgi:hypothetical protein
VSVNVSLVSAGNQNVPLVGRSNARRAFIYSKAELPFVIVWGELRGSATLVNSTAKLFYDVTSILSPLIRSYVHNQLAYSDQAGFGRDQDSGACGFLFDWLGCNGRY